MAPINKPTVGQPGWNTAVDAAIDKVNAHDLNPLVTAAVDTTGAAVDDVLAVGPASGQFRTRTPAQIKALLALGNVDNTADSAKPVSTAQQTALDAKAATADLAVFPVGRYPSTQAALTAAGAAGGGIVQLPAGIIGVSSALSVPANVRLRGAGRNATRLQWAAATGDAVTLAGAYAGISDLSLEGTNGAPTAGALLVLGTGGYQTAANLSLSSGYDNLRCDDAYGWTLDNCYIVTPVRYGCLLRSLASPDRGDSVIRSCTFDTANQTTGTAIRYESGGGLKLSGTKIMHHAYGIDLQVADGAATSILLITGCSVENQATACVRLGRAGTTGTFTEILLVGCQLNGGTTGKAVVTGAGVEDVSITGNTFKGNAANTAIALDTLQRVAISGNSFRGWGTAISKTGSTPRIVVGDNNYGDVPIPLVDDVAQNLPNPGRSARVHRSRLSVTDAVAYTNLFRVEWNTYRGSVLDLTIEGLLGGVGNVTRHVRLIAKRDAGNVATTIVTDTAAGAACDIQYDVTTTAGSLLIGVRRNTAAGGTQLDASVTLSTEGGARLIQLL